MLQGQTAMHSAATLNDDNNCARFWWRGSWSSFETPINLDYQQAVETLMSHSADLSVQVNTGGQPAQFLGYSHGGCGAT